MSIHFIWILSFSQWSKSHFIDSSCNIWCIIRWDTVVRGEQERNRWTSENNVFEMQKKKTKKIKPTTTTYIEIERSSGKREKEITDRVLFAWTNCSDELIRLASSSFPIFRIVFDYIIKLSQIYPSIRMSIYWSGR